MAIDKAEWQYDSAMKIYCEKNGKILDDLTEDDEDIIWDCAGNHIAFFIAWLIRRDHIGDLHHEEESEEQELEDVKKQQKTGMDIFKKYCDMCFTREDVADDILPFVEKYYDEYMDDYSRIMGDSRILSTSFVWDDYLKVEEAIDEAYRNYVAG